MTLVLAIAVGGIFGWLFSMVIALRSHQDLRFNVTVGVLGAVLAGAFLTPLVGGAALTDGNVNLLALLAAMIGALMLLGVVEILRRDTQN